MIDQAKPQDIHTLANLIHFDSFVHRHLDYRPPLDWVGDFPFNVYREKNRIQAALACPPDPPHIAWIRLFAVAYHIQIAKAWDLLWRTTYEQIQEKSEVRFIAAIPFQNWFAQLLERQKFEIAQQILMLSWENDSQSNIPGTNKIHIRAMALDDMDAVTNIDNKAFTPLWQISGEYLQIAYHQSNIATVAEIDGNICGFQISTATSGGGHLARLAVIPSRQGQGIGSALLHDLIHQFKRRGATTITVNTQEDNHASLSLYKKAGFDSTGEKYPVYVFNLKS